MGFGKNLNNNATLPKSLLNQKGAIDIKKNDIDISKKTELTLEITNLKLDIFKNWFKKVKMLSSFFDTKKREYTFKFDNVWKKIEIIFDKYKRVKIIFIKPWKDETIELFFDKKNLETKANFIGVIEKVLWKDNELENVIEEYYEKIYEKIYSNKINLDKKDTLNDPKYKKNNYIINWITNFLFISSKISLNEESDVVLQLSKVLKLLWFYNWNITKIYNSSLDNSLKKFQIDNNILKENDIDLLGILWYKTLKKIKQLLKEKNKKDKWNIIEDLLVEGVIISIDKPEEAEKRIKSKILKHSDFLYNKKPLRINYDRTIISKGKEIVLYKYIEKEFTKIKLDESKGLLDIISGLPAQESLYNNDLVSSAGAFSIFQFTNLNFIEQIKRWILDNNEFLTDDDRELLSNLKKVRNLSTVYWKNKDYIKLKKSFISSEEKTVKSAVLYMEYINYKLNNIRIKNKKGKLETVKINNLEKLSELFWLSEIEKNKFKSYMIINSYNSWDLRIRILIKSFYEKYKTNKKIKLQKYTALSLLYFITSYWFNNEKSKLKNYWYDSSTYVYKIMAARETLKKLEINNIKEEPIIIDYTKERNNHFDKIPLNIKIVSSKLSDQAINSKYAKKGPKGLCAAWVKDILKWCWDKNILDSNNFLWVKKMDAYQMIKYFNDNSITLIDYNNTKDKWKIKKWYLKVPINFPSDWYPWWIILYDRDVNLLNSKWNINSKKLINAYKKSNDTKITEYRRWLKNKYYWSLYVRKKGNNYYISGKSKYWHVEIVTKDLENTPRYSKTDIIKWKEIHPNLRFIYDWITPVPGGSAINEFAIELFLDKYNKNRSLALIEAQKEFRKKWVDFYQKSTGFTWYIYYPIK